MLSRLTKQTPPAPRFDHTAAVHVDRYLQIFGGCSHSTFFNDLHVLDLGTAHRVSHKLWTQSRKPLALALQSRISDVFAVDIHPGAKLGKGILFDHATGVVVGETAVIGDNVSILHHVTLGGTGKAGGDRHPKIGDGVLIGAGATILGNVKIGAGAKIGAGSVVLINVSLLLYTIFSCFALQLEWSQPQVQGSLVSPRAGHAGVFIDEKWIIVGGGDNKSVTMT